MQQRGAKKKVLLVICIDRDNDVGVKAGVSGPIIGRADNIDAANRLALKDPGDSDVNAIFKAVQVFDRIKAKNPAEIVTLTGDPDVGIASDRKISEQLDRVLLRYDVSEAVLVTDGAEDEHILPLIRAKIGSVFTEKIIVKQSQHLESTYYVIYDFVVSILEDPKTARIFIGLPAIALLIYAVFGSMGWRLIIGVAGSYLLIKGFKLERYVKGAYFEILVSLEERRAPFFIYLSASVALIIGVLSGYDSSLATGTSSAYMAASAFLRGSVILFALAAALAGFGRILSKKRHVLQYLTYFGALASVAWITYEIAGHILNEKATHEHILFALGASGIIMLACSYAEKIYKRPLGKRQREMKSHS